MDHAPTRRTAGEQSRKFGLLGSLAIHRLSIQWVKVAIAPFIGPEQWAQNKGAVTTNDRASSKIKSET